VTAYQILNFSEAFVGSILLLSSLENNTANVLELTCGIKQSSFT